VQSTMRIEVRGLPAGYEGNDFAGDSTPLEDVFVSVLIYGSDMANSARTDEAGFATLNNLSEGNYQVILDIPDDVADFVTVFGTEDGFEPREHEGQDTNKPVVYLGPQEQLNGTFYVIPVDSAGENEPGSFQIDVRGLPVEYEGSQWWNDSNPLANIELTVAIPASEFAVTATTNASGQAFFEDLGEGDYYVILGVPGDAADFVTYFGGEGDTEPRPHDGRNTNQTTVHLNAGAEPTETPAQVGGEPVKDLPNTGAGSEESDAGTEIYIAFAALVALATLGTVVTRRRT
jgi:hypothetical protein